jgi:site-specific DNA-methyltransferase (adenine-specific)
MISEVFNCDCKDYMLKLPDKFFDLAIVDPPYGGNVEGSAIERTGGSWSSKYQQDNNIKNWDFPPCEFYFRELFRVSKNQIIWGANYFVEHLKNHRCFVIWEKETISENFTMAMVEYAWTSFNNKNAKLFKYRPQDSSRIHPTQKPVALYKWLLQNYATPGDKIFDSHMGSQSSRIAAHQMGFDYWGCEINEVYFQKGNERFEKAAEQGMLFSQEALF